MNNRPTYYANVEDCVEKTLRKVGSRVALGTPLGPGKANHLVNEFFRRACEDSKIDLHIFTALTLSRPRWKDELERRFLQPLNERIFAGYPELEYVEPLKRGLLPKNIRVTEFYFQPGSFRKDYRIPDHARNNQRARLEMLLNKYRERGLFTSFPFGTDLTDEELVLRKALLALKQTIERKKLFPLRVSAIRKAIAARTLRGHIWNE